jgi:3-oxoacyl-[acyl-carrier protein] reductase
MAGMALQHKVAVITGGAKGIGRETADVFLKNGATVVILDIDDEKANEAIDQWTFQGLPCYYFKVNTADFVAVSQVADRIIPLLGKVDILINNAGITRDATLKNLTPERWQEVLEVNLTGVFNCTKIFSSFMVKQQYGRIINASSVTAHYGSFGQSNYVASKAALIGLTKVWAKELGSKGITVNAVAPGFIETDMTAVLGTEFMGELLNRTPVNRIGTTSDIAHAYLFLASENAGFITGTCLNVDGGLTL